MKKLVMGILMASILTAGGVNVVSAMNSTNMVSTPDTYTHYNFYYDMYHADPPNNLTKEDLQLAVQWGELTPAEYEKIVGEPYPG